jgi:hypothetical protein
MGNKNKSICIGTGHNSCFEAWYIHPKYIPQLILKYPKRVKNAFSSHHRLESHLSALAISDWR